MKSSNGNVGIIVGILISAAGVLMLVLPPSIRADMMDWGFGSMYTGIAVIIAGIITLLFYLRRRQVWNRMSNSREVLARWTYDAATWRESQNKERNANKGMPALGMIIGGIILAIGLVYYLGDPDEMGMMLAIMAGVALSIVLASWLGARARNRSILQDPGEVIIVRGGVYHKGQLTDWNKVTAWFDLARLEEEDGHFDLVISYHYLAGRSGQTHSNRIYLPVPPGKEQEAQFAADRLNVQPY